MLSRRLLPLCALIAFASCDGAQLLVGAERSPLGQAGSAGSVHIDGSGQPCTPGVSVPCYSGPASTRSVGACRDGAFTCVEVRQGEFSTYVTDQCRGDLTPQTEACNGQDDDCDGQTDEGCPGSAGGQGGAGQAGASGSSGQSGSGGAGQGGSGGSAGSAQAGAGGGITKGPLDEVIAAMAPGSWKELPSTSMASVCPPGSSYYCESVVSAWSGGALDTIHDRLVVFGGGYSDSSYNNVFAFDLNTGTWKRWTELPAGLSTNPVAPAFVDKRIETCGLYPSVSSLTIPDAWLTPTGYLPADRCDEPSIVPQLDPQQPRSTSTLGNVAFSALTGRFYLLGSASMFPSGQASSQRVMGFDFATKSWVRGANNPHIGLGTSATDEAGRIWYAGTANNLFAHYEPDADTWVTHQSYAKGCFYAGADVDTKRKRMVLTQDGLSLTVYDLTNPDAAPQQPATSGLGAKPGQAPGFVYVPSLDRFALWSGGQQVHWLDPDKLTWSSTAGSGDDPGEATKNGTFGRFRFSQKRNVFVVVNSTKTNVFLFKPP